MPETTKTHLSPLQLYQHIFCKNCQNHCNPTETRFQNCILCLIADELTRTRQLLQQRTQHLLW
ncbi:MAG: hypothetical protein K6T73_06920 [Candidatus Bathyarchaeota archaeon]|nr:hypothetical protein [Candidatus Bathyarchaeota archaeon]